MNCTVWTISQQGWYFKLSSATLDTVWFKGKLPCFLLGKKEDWMGVSVQGCGLGVTQHGIKLSPDNWIGHKIFQKKEFWWKRKPPHWNQISAQKAKVAWSGWSCSLNQWLRILSLHRELWSQLPEFKACPFICSWVCHVQASQSLNASTFSAVQEGYKQHSILFLEGGEGLDQNPEPRLDLQNAIAEGKGGGWETVCRLLATSLLNLPVGLILPVFSVWKPCCCWAAQVWTRFFLASGEEMKKLNSNLAQAGPLSF